MRHWQNMSALKLEACAPLQHLVVVCFAPQQPHFEQVLVITVRQRAHRVVLAAALRYTANKHGPKAEAPSVGSKPKAVTENKFAQQLGYLVASLSAARINQRGQQGV